MNNEDIPINSIYVEPKTRKYCNFTVNESQTHTKDYDSLKTYLATIMPNFYKEIDILINKKAYFIIFPQEKIIKEFKFDLFKENLSLGNNLKHEKVGKALKNENSNSKGSSSDKFFKKFSSNFDSQKKSQFNRLLDKILK